MYQWYAHIHYLSPKTLVKLESDPCQQLHAIWQGWLRRLIKGLYISIKRLWIKYLTLICFPQQRWSGWRVTSCRSGRLRQRKLPRRRRCTWRLLPCLCPPHPSQTSTGPYRESLLSMYVTLQKQGTYERLVDHILVKTLNTLAAFREAQVCWQEYIKTYERTFMKFPQ